MVGRYAIIENDAVINIALAKDDFAQEHGWIPAANAAIGDEWDGTSFTKPIQEDPQPQPVTATNILQQLTAEEAEKLVDVLVLREVLTPERAQALKERR